MSRELLRQMIQKDKSSDLFKTERLKEAQLIEVEKSGKSGGHWITHNGKHIFVGGGGSNGSAGKSSSVANSHMATDIAHQMSKHGTVTTTVSGDTVTHSLRFDGKKHGLMHHYAPKLDKHGYEWNDGESAAASHEGGHISEYTDVHVHPSGKKATVNYHPDEGGVTVRHPL